MFDSLFLNPAALTVGGALVSAPILIHLINRMRFKKLRWAAMEFLLKSQKRNRRRLIIEQLLLLLLRCLLILLAGLLLSRFIGCSGVWGKGFDQKANLHIILLDDTLSMRDKVKPNDLEFRQVLPGVANSLHRPADDCFKVGANEILTTIATNVSQSSTDDGIAILRPSDALRGPTYVPKVYRRLNDSTIAQGMAKDVAGMECTALHLSLVASLQKIKEAADAKEDKITVHLVSDFRKSDWTGADAKDLHKLMLDLAKHENVKKVYLIDTAHPLREPEQGGVPAYNDNIGIVEVRPSTRVASDGSTVFITATMINYSPRDVDVKVVPYNNVDGREISEKNYETPMPLKIPAGKTAQATFNFPVRAELKDYGKGFVRVGVRLLDAAGLPLKNDGLADDDVRHSVVEVRKTIPVLIIDDGRDETRRPGGDSYYIATALKSVTNSKYEVHFGDQVARAADAREALESPELAGYTSILMLDVPKLLSDGQRESLERFIRDGGGVCFFMGPDVQAKYYNEELYRKGFGIFPVPLADTFFPLAGEKLKPPEYTGRYQVLLRDDQFPKTEKLPIFGPVFKQVQQREWLKHLPVQRYWPARPLGEWVGEPGQVREVANLPNEDVASKYASEVDQLVKKLPVDREEYRDWRTGLKRHGGYLSGAVGQGTKIPAYKLAELVEFMLLDRGKENDRSDFPNMVEFWDLRDQVVQDVKQDAVNLRKRLLYSSPLVVVKDFGRGRVVAWMTTAGKEWNPWAGGATGSPIYAPLIYELQNYLTSQSGDSGQLVGSPLTLGVDAKRFDQNKTLKVVRKFYKPMLDNPEVAQLSTEHQGTREKGMWSFKFDNSLQPGFYESRLMYGDASEAAPALSSWGHVFNVDTRHEGNLQRTSQEDLDSAFMRQAGDKVEWRRKGEPGDNLANRAWDLSEWPFFFLFFIAILVAEQALAVHLSFHLKGSEAELPAQVLKAQARAA